MMRKPRDPDDQGAWAIEYQPLGCHGLGPWLTFHDGLSLEYAIKRLAAHLRYYGNENRTMQIRNRNTDEIIPAELL